MFSVVPSIGAHPLPALLDAVVRCTVNGDDPLLFGGSLVDEYELCRRKLGFNDDRLAILARCSIEASGAPTISARRRRGHRSLAGCTDLTSASQFGSEDL